jgi:hypothetical protein
LWPDVRPEFVKIRGGGGVGGGGAPGGQREARWRAGRSQVGSRPLSSNLDDFGLDVTPVIKIRR